MDYRASEARRGSAEIRGYKAMGRATVNHSSRIQGLLGNQPVLISFIRAAGVAAFWLESLEKP